MQQSRTNFKMGKTSIQLSGRQSLQPGTHHDRKRPPDILTPSRRRPLGVSPASRRRFPNIPTAQNGKTKRPRPSGRGAFETVPNTGPGLLIDEPADAFRFARLLWDSRPRRSHQAKPDSISRFVDHRAVCEHENAQHQRLVLTEPPTWSSRSSWRVAAQPSCSRPSRRSPSRSADLVPGESGTQELPAVAEVPQSRPSDPARRERPVPRLTPAR